jgi:hypothetical protein
MVVGLAAAQGTEWHAVSFDSDGRMVERLVASSHPLLSCQPSWCWAERLVQDVSGYKRRSRLVQLQLTTNPLLPLPSLVVASAVAPCSGAIACVGRMLAVWCGSGDTLQLALHAPNPRPCSQVKIPPFHPPPYPHRCSCGGVRLSGCSAFHMVISTSTVSSSHE